jgi:hypothetical protein
MKRSPKSNLFVWRILIFVKLIEINFSSEKVNKWTLYDTAKRKVLLQIFLTNFTTFLAKTKQVKMVKTY